MGARAAGGVRVRTNGCDHFTCRNGLIQLENAWRKTRGRATACGVDAPRAKSRFGK